MEVIGYGYASLIFELLIFFLGGGIFSQGVALRIFCCPFRALQFMVGGRVRLPRAVPWAMFCCPFGAMPPFRGLTYRYLGHFIKTENSESLA